MPIRDPPIAVRPIEETEVLTITVRVVIRTAVRRSMHLALHGSVVALGGVVVAVKLIIVHIRK